MVISKISFPVKIVMDESHVDADPSVNFGTNFVAMEKNNFQIKLIVNAIFDKRRAINNS